MSETCDTGGWNRAGNRPRLALLPLNVLQQCIETMLDQDLSRQFVVETQARAIDACNDVAELRRIAKTLLTAWHLQTDMTRHFGAQALGITPPSP
ncbi:MAG: hypothetical protein ACKOZT_04105 [Cyanobium sp.]